MRQVQHKKEAYWFYRFLSIFYDDYVNPFFWTTRMRNAALELAHLHQPDLSVIDVGSGTGFTTEGIVQSVNPMRVVCIDQSDHQMAKAKAKPQLQGCTFQLGDAEEIPYPADTFDRYVSAGSIEYWPEPQRGIAEAYRILKPDGRALMIGPLRPQNPIARAAADAWMLFPTEEAYISWFENAGFTDLEKRYVAPSWVSSEKYAIALSGRKPQAGESPAVLPPRKLEDVGTPMDAGRAVQFATRLLTGSLAGGIFIPMALLGYARQLLSRALGNSEEEIDPLTPQQKSSLLGLATAALLFLFWRATRRTGPSA